MITLRKLRTLRPDTRLRKIALILQDAEKSSVKHLDTAYLVGVFEIVADIVPDTRIPLPDELSPERQDERRRICNAARHRILASLGAEPAEWDLYHAEDQPVQSDRTLPMAIYLDDIRSPFNVGSIFRTAAAMGVSTVYLSKDTPLPSHRRVVRSSMGATGTVPWEVTDMQGIPVDRPIFALETGGTPLDEFAFPHSGICIVGSEELGVSPPLLSRARASAGVVSIPMAGGKASLNVGVSVGILMHYWRRFLLSD
jgi:TrmH family RNA methyltransferase